MTWQFAATINPHGPCRAPAGHWRTGDHYHVVWPHQYGHWCYPTADAATERLDDLDIIDAELVDNDDTQPTSKENQ